MNISMLKRFFLWCTIINLGILIVWSVVFIGAQEFVYNVQSAIFSMSREAFSETVFSSIARFKTLFVIFNLVPLIALAIIDRRSGASSLDRQHRRVLDVGEHDR